MKNTRIFLSKNFHVLIVKFSIYLNRRVFVMQDKWGEVRFPFKVDPFSEGIW